MNSKEHILCPEGKHWIPKDQYPCGGCQLEEQDRSDGRQPRNRDHWQEEITLEDYLSEKSPLPRTNTDNIKRNRKDKVVSSYENYRPRNSFQKSREEIQKPSSRKKKLRVYKIPSVNNDIYILDLSAQKFNPDWLQLFNIRKKKFLPHNLKVFMEKCKDITNTVEGKSAIKKYNQLTRK